MLDCGTEAEHLSEIMIADLYDTEEYERWLDEMYQRYYENKNIPTGNKIKCACCGKTIIKHNYQTQFCSNKGSGNCKDRFWNNIDEQRRNRQKKFRKV